MNVDEAVGPSYSTCLAALSPFDPSTLSPIEPIPTSPLSLSLPLSPFLPPSPLLLAASPPSDIAEAIVLNAAAPPAALQRKVAHRLMDVNRRQREQTAIDTLTDLVITDVDDGCKKPDKVSVLNAAIATIQQLMRRTKKLRKSRRRYREDRHVQQLYHNDDRDDEHNTPKRRRHHSTPSLTSTSSSPLSPSSSSASSSFRQEFFCSLFMNSPLLHVISNAETGNCIFVNQTFLLFSGYNLSDLMGLKIEAPQQAYLLHDDVDELHYISSSRLRRNGQYVPLLKPTSIQTFSQSLAALHRGQTSSVIGIFQMLNCDGVWYDIRRQFSLTTVTTSSSSSSSDTPRHVTLLHVEGAILGPSQSQSPSHTRGDYHGEQITPLLLAP